MQNPHAVFDGSNTTVHEREKKGVQVEELKDEGMENL